MYYMKHTLKTVIWNWSVTLDILYYFLNLANLSQSEIINREDPRPDILQTLEVDQRKSVKEVFIKSLEEGASKETVVSQAMEERGVPRRKRCSTESKLFTVA